MKKQSASSSRAEPNQTVISKIFLRWNTHLPSVGSLAMAAVFIATVSGVILAISYDIKEPYHSLQAMAIGNSAAVFFRGLHYWAAQLFLVLIFSHIIEHLARKGEKEVGWGIWLRLMIVLPITGYVMISGFILKGDPEGLLARRILGGLLQTIPLWGDRFEMAVLGPINDLQITYIHHSATAAVCLLFIMFEHMRRVWCGRESWVWIMSISVILTYGAGVGLHDGFDPIVKGPWYFLGMQEILGWTTRPGIVILCGALLLGLMAALPRLPGPASRGVKVSLGWLCVVYIVLSIIGGFFRGANWVWQWPL